MLRAWMGLIVRDLGLAVRHGMDSLAAVVFFLLAVTLFPFGVGPEPQVLARIAAGVLWVAALLASMLSMDRLFLADYEDGSLEQLTLGALPPAAIAAAKITAHCLLTALPLLATAPFLAVLLQLEARALPALLAALALGAPSLSLIGGVGAALVLGARRSGPLLALLVLPLYIPVLIFGVAAVEAAATGLPAGPHLAMLASILLGSAVLAPVAAGAAIREAVGQ